MLSIPAFLSYVFVASFTPGPNTIMAMTNGSYFGYKKALNFIFGVTTGFSIVMLLSSYFNLLLLNFIPKIKFFMSLLGFGYMLFLAFKILKSKQNVNDQVSDTMNTFRTGVTMQFVNPKAILYGITVTSSFIIPYYQSNTSLFLFSLFLAFVGFLAVSCWALFGAMFQKFINQYRKPFNILMALLLVYSAISIVK